MHRLVLSVITACAVCVSWMPIGAAEREWRTGTWLPHAGIRGYIIETDRMLVTTAEPPDADAAALAPRDGATVQYVIEKDLVVLRDAAGHEHSLSVVTTAQKYSPDYNAVGGGHLVKSVSRDGSRVTLEDGSRWDMDESRRFAVAEWQADDLIFVRRHPDDADFAFDLENTTQDDGALANYRVR
jgi:hypothetical protein